MAANLLSRGDIFAGRYRIERSIGAGGMGAVFEAEHLETERRVALKVLLPHSLVSETARERFKQEARVAGRIRHPHIVDVIDAGVDDITNMPYLVMELLHGEDLGTRVQRIGAMSAEETVALLTQVASALDCLHERSIVHRDLKPENLFLTWAEDGSRVVKLLDFGVAKVIAEGKSSALTQDAQGTPVYMAPEQFAEQIRISAATDIYAIGMVAFTLLTGEHYWGPEISRGMNVFMLARIAEGGPKEPATLRASRQGAILPAAFDDWFSTVTALAPGERYPTAGDAVEALAEALTVSPRETVPGDASAPAAPSPPKVDPPVPKLVEKTPPSQGRRFIEEKSAVATTPPIPLRRPLPFWRRPSTMPAVIVGIALVLSYALVVAVRSSVRSGEAGGPGSSRPVATSSVPGQPLSAASPPSSDPPPGPPTAAVPSSSPSTGASTVVPASASASVTASASAPAPQAPRPPRTPVPATTKRPKYTRE
jgi:eukaryotic-like serine/threonine-protein kinase